LLRALIPATRHARSALENLSSASRIRIISSMLVAIECTLIAITERFGVSEPASQLIRDTPSMPDGVSKPVEPRLANRQPRRTNEP
jgi:hypothetical protein